VRALTGCGWAATSAGGVGEAQRASVVLHDLNPAAAHADRIAVVDDDGSEGGCVPADVLTSELPSEVYRREEEVLAHPRSGTPLVLPVP
jgi:iron complex transport system ATP-binding protein